MRAAPPPPPPSYGSYVTFRAKLSVMIRATTLESKHIKIILLTLQAFNINNYSWSYSSFIRCENCERLCFSCNLSAFASRFQHSRIRALRNFFGQEGHSPQSSEVRRFPHAYVHSFIKSYVCSLDRSFIRSFVRPSVRPSVPSFLVCLFLHPPGVLLIWLYRYVRPQRVWIFSRFGHNWGIEFWQFWS